MKIKKKIKNLSKKNYLFRKIYNKLVDIRRWIYYRRVYKKIEIDDKMILFESFWGKKYACSPKAIYEYIVNNPKYKDYKLVWAFRNVKERRPDFCKNKTILVKYNSRKYYRYHAKAKYWVSNTRIPECLVKKQGQVYLQCWHGTPLKRLAFDIKVEGNVLSSTREVRKQFARDVKRYDYMISPSPFATEKFTSAFHIKELHPNRNIIIEKGYPRNDFLFQYTDKDVKEIKEKLGLPENKKVILYAPTFRDNQHQLGVGYTLDLGLNLNKLQEKFKDEYIVLMRLHYLVADKLDLRKYQGFAYDVSKLDDVNELYVISDMLITDYSSVFFDYANLKKPIIFYMYDLKEYGGQIRGFYIDLDELPGPIIEEQDSLFEEIKNVEQNKGKYKEKYQAFNKKFNCLDDKEASKRVVETFIK